MLFTHWMSLPIFIFLLIILLPSPTHRMSLNFYSPIRFYLLETSTLLTMYMVSHTHCICRIDQSSHLSRELFAYQMSFSLDYKLYDQALRDQFCCDYYIPSAKDSTWQVTRTQYLPMKSMSRSFCILASDSYKRKKVIIPTRLYIHANL
jgi:hypothetical protein